MSESVVMNIVNDEGLLSSKTAAACLDLTANVMKKLMGGVLNTMDNSDILELASIALNNELRK